MAIYRNVSMSFWTDNKIADDFTPEDKYFYLYLFTNPHTNLCGCYEVSIGQIAYETGYTKETIERIIDRFEKVHKVVSYSPTSKEILLINWHRYNWTNSEKFRISLLKEIEHIKEQGFKEYLLDLFNGKDTVFIRYPYGMDTTVTVTDTVTDIDAVTDLNNNKDIYKEYNISEYLLDAVDEWIAYKKERHFIYKERGLKTLLKTIQEKSREYGDKAVAEAILESISSGYQGIVFEKLERGRVTKNQRFRAQTQRSQLDYLLNSISDSEDSEGGNV